VNILTRKAILSKTYPIVSRFNHSSKVSLFSLLLLIASIASGSPIELYKILANDGWAGDYFGRSVAISGEVIIVGAPYSYKGSAYVFERSNDGSWSQVAKLTASDGAGGDHFGISVATDGNAFVVGAPQKDTAGSAYVFERNTDGFWSQVAKLTASDGAMDDYFGNAVAIDGSTVIVGAEGDDDVNENAGSVYIFEKLSGTWTNTAKLTASDGGRQHSFGNSVAIDGENAAVGAYRAYMDANLDTYSGSIYVFKKDSGIWTQAAKLTASDAAKYDHLGTSVAISGETVIGGAYFDDSKGSAYVFSKDIEGSWNQVAKLTASDGSTNDYFGYATAISGRTIVVGALRNNNNGSVYLFEEGSTGIWTQTAKLITNDGFTEDNFGRAVGIAGNTLVLGAQRDDDRGENSGSAYIFGYPEISFNTATQMITEGTSTTLTLTRTGSNTTVPLTVDLSVTTGLGTADSDYTLSGASISGQSGNVTVTIPGGRSYTTITVVADDDMIDEDLENLTLTLVDHSDYDLSSPSIANLAITDDNDTAGVTITPTSGLTTTEGGGEAEFNLVLTSEPTANVTIGFSSSNTSEGSMKSGSFTFTTIDWNQAQTITVAGVDDDVDDGDIAYAIITSTSTSDTKYDALDPADVNLINTDDDTAGITITPTSGLITSEAGGEAQFEVSLSSQPVADVIIALDSTDTTEGTVSPESLTFTSLNWDQIQTITITGANDDLDDGDIRYTIITNPATSSDSTYSGLDPEEVSLINTDNDTAGITVTLTSGLHTHEGGGTATFNVMLDTEPTADVTIELRSSNTSEGTVEPTTLNFTTDNWNQAQSVTITGVDDGVEDGGIGYSIVLIPATSDDPDYNGVDPEDVLVTNHPVVIFRSGFEASIDLIPQ